MSPITGRRRRDTVFGQIPDDPQPGDIWKYVHENGSVVKASEVWPNSNAAKQNLTDRVWGYCSPSDGRIGTLGLHTVREHEDGTVSIRPGDGSSNSVMYMPDRPEQWHGYVEHNVWTEC